MTHRMPIVLLLLLMLPLLAPAGLRAAPSATEPAAQAATPPGSAFEQLDLLVDIRHELVTDYVEQPDKKKMIESAVRAMIDSLEDPYTVYLAPQELEPFERSVRGAFSGIGAEVDVHNGHLRIVTPLEDAPAWKAGVLPGDTVLEIDGKSTKGGKLPEHIARLTGPEGTKVTLRLLHEDGKESTVTITRARIEMDTVRGFSRDEAMHWRYMIDPVNKVGYVRVVQFTDRTAESLKQALNSILEQGGKAVILDMRYNPGGLLDAAVGVSELFLTEGQRIVSIKGRSVPEAVHNATAKDDLPSDFSVVVLANEASASAAEIVTGALSDNKRGLFVGARTFGKGSVQQVRMLDSGLGALKLTNAYYYLPNGRNIHRRAGSDTWGVDPDDACYVPMNAEAQRQALEARRENAFLRGGKNAGPTPTVDPDWIERELLDPQLAAALRAAVGKIAAGQWPKVGQDGREEIIKLTRRENLVRQRELIQRRLEEIQEELASLDGKAKDLSAKKPGDDKPRDVASAPGDAP